MNSALPASDNTPRLYTTRQYPCGCKAEGPGDVPAYCSEHSPLGAQWERFTADRFPPEDGKLLVWYGAGRHRYVATLDYDRESYPFKWLLEQGITHWMLAPEGPRS